MGNGTTVLEKESRDAAWYINDGDCGYEGYSIKIPRETNGFPGSGGDCDASVDVLRLNAF